MPPSAVEHSVCARADAEQTAQRQDGGRTPDGGRYLGGAAVAAGVHRRREGDRTLQRALQDRESDVQQATQPTVGAAPQTAGGAQPPAVRDQVRREGERDDRRDARLVQGPRERLQQPRRVREGVRRADADEERGQFQAVVQREEQALGGDPAADTDALGPVGEGELGRVTRRWVPGTGEPRKTANASRMPRTAMPSLTTRCGRAGGVGSAGGQPRNRPRLRGGPAGGGWWCGRRRFQAQGPDPPGPWEGVGTVCLRRACHRRSPY